MQISSAQARALGIKLPAAASLKRREKKPPPPDSYVAHDCVILAIDPANVSGWAIIRPGEPRHLSVISGETAEGQRLVVGMARDSALEESRPLVIVAEKWTTGDRTNDRRMHVATLLGLGAAWERWRMAIDFIGVPKSRLVRVNVATWRAKIIGGPMNRTTEEWKKLAFLHANRRFPTSIVSQPGRVFGEDESDALCIAAWAERAGPVGDAVKRAGKRYP